MAEFFEWSKDEHKTFAKDGELVFGKWTFYHHKKLDQYEATMSGVYTHVFNTLDDMLHRRNEVDFYEYCPILSEENGKETIINSDGNVREY